MTAPVRRRGPIDPRLFTVVPNLSSLRLGAALTGAIIACGGGCLLVQLTAAAKLVESLAHGRSTASALLLLTGATLGRAILRRLEQSVCTRAAARVQTELSTAVVEAGLAMGPLRLAEFGPGRLTALATSGAETITEYVVRYLPTLVPAALLPPTVVLLLALVDRRSAVTVLLTLPLIPVFGALIGWATERRARAQWRLMSELSAHFLDVVQGLVTLRAYRRAQRQVAVLQDVAERHREASVRVLRLAFLSGTALELVGTLSVGLVAVSAGLRVAGGSLNLGPALLVILLAPEAYRPLREVGARFHDSADATAVLDDLEAAIAASNADGRSAAAQNGTATNHDSQVLLRAEGLSLTMPVTASTGPLRLMPGVDLTVRAGHVVAVVGPSGIGKSTLMRIVTGQVRPDAGTLHTSASAYLPQRVTFPHARTLREAVTAGWPEVPDQVLRAALRDASATEWIQGLPGGLDSTLSEAAKNLSAGQRQRLALARTLIRADRIDQSKAGSRCLLVLDEPTAHLDAATEQEVLRGLRRRVREGSAVLMVAHRPAAIADADEIVTLGAAPPHVRAAPTSMAGPAPLAPAQQVRLRPNTNTDRAAASVRRGPARHDWRSSMPAAIAMGTLSSLSGIALTAVAAWLLTRASTRPPILTLTVAVVAVRLFAILRPLLGYLDKLIAHDAALQCLGGLRAEVLQGLVPRVPGRLVPRRGDLLIRMVNDVDAIPDALLRWRRPALTIALTTALSVAGAALISGPVALAAVPGLLIATLLAPAIVSFGAESRTDRIVAARARHAQAVAETLAGAEDVVAVGSPAAALTPVRDASRELARAGRRQAMRSATSDACRLLGNGLSALSVAVTICGFHVGAGISALSAAGSGNGSGLTLESAAVLLLGTLALGDVNAALPEAALARGRAATARRRLADILTSEPLSSDPVVPLAPPQQRDISARSLVVDWNEDPASQPVLGGVDLFVPAGSTVAVQGASGAGKSTLVAALLRFLDPRSGTLTLGGTDMSAMLGADVRTVVGLVSDDEHIFATSVRENLRLAAPEATDDALRSALHRVRLGAWLAALPQGLDTWLGESGARMSSGERRRLAMARAVLANQSVLVLDEPAESLDEPTAQAVLGDLFAAWAGRSVILVTHRDDGLDLVDHVLQLDNGRLAELPARGLGPSSAGRSAATVELAGWSG